MAGIVWDVGRHGSPRDGLLRHWMPLGLSHGLFDLSRFERYRLRQHQINRRPYVEEKTGVS